MNIEVEVGLSCEVIGESNVELPAPIMAFYTGDSILPVWREIAPMLEKAAGWGRGEYEVNDILTMTALKQMQVWAFRQDGKLILAGATRITQRPRCQVCEIYALAGCRMAEMWEHFHKVLLQWCDSLGVAHIETTCRTEVAEKIQKFGFEPMAHVLRFQRKDES